MCCFSQTLVGATVSSIVERGALHLFKIWEKEKNFQSYQDFPN